jgi:hypothetical protein
MTRSRPPPRVSSWLASPFGLVDLDLEMDDE